MNQDQVTWQVSQLPHCPPTAHFTLSSVKLSLSLGEFAYFHAVWNETLLKSYTLVYASKKCLCFINNKLVLFIFLLFYIFIKLFHKFLKPNKCTTIKTESCVCESLSVPIQSTVFQNVPEGQEPELRSWQMTATDRTLRRQFKAENFEATMLKTQNSRICVH